MGPKHIVGRKEELAHQAPGSAFREATAAVPRPPPVSQPREFLPLPEAETRRSTLKKVAIGDAVKAGDGAAADDNVAGVVNSVAGAN
jgi:hypothetical protein